MVSIRKIQESDVKGVKVQKNLNIAKALFKIVFESIYDGFGDRPIITREDVSRIEKKIDESWHHVESLFDNTCAQCTDIPWYVRDERRKDAITRLVYVRLMMLIDTRMTTWGVEFPRVVVPGLQSMISSMLTNREWEILNDHAYFIFGYVGSDDDAVLAEQLKLNRAVQLLCQRIFLTLEPLAKLSSHPAFFARTSNN